MTGTVDDTAHVGLLSLSYSREWNIFATGGSDRSVRIWDDASLHQLEVCKGHTAPVVQVMCNGADGQIVSCAADKTIKVWDIFSYRCVQTLRDESLHFPRNELSCAALDTERRCIVATGSTLGIWAQDTRPEKMLQEVELDNAPTHSSAVVSVLWSPEFEQLVTVDEQGAVKVWEQAGGCMQQALTFDVGHTHTGGGNHNALPISAAVLDLRSRRLVTGAHDGSIWTWNINTGAALQYVGRQKTTQKTTQGVSGIAEVSSLNYVSWTSNRNARSDEVLVATGWGGALTLWGNYAQEGSAEDQDRIELPHCALAGHKSDVVASVVCRTHLVSACTKGHLLMWPISRLSPGAIVKAHLPSCAPLRPECRVGGSNELSASALCYMGARHLLLVGCDDGNLYSVRMSSRTSIEEFSWSDPLVSVGTGVQCVACNDDGTVLVGCDTVGELKVWRVGSAPGGQLQLTLLAEHTLRRLARLTKAQRRALQATLKAMFDTIDTDHSGLIEADEFYMMCVRLDETMTDYDIKRSWSRMDLDGDAKITFAEFCEWWEEEDRKKATVKANSIAFVPLDGSFYCGDDAGNVHRFDANGTLVAQLSPEQAEA